MSSGKKRNPYAQALQSGIFQNKIVPNKRNDTDDDCPSCGDNFYNCVCFLDKEEELDDG